MRWDGKWGEIKIDHYLSHNLPSLIISPRYHIRDDFEIGSSECLNEMVSCETDHEMVDCGTDNEIMRW